MATKSRTYKPTDWQVWIYTPVAGKFRLDFSTLDGADVLGGSTDTGSVQVLPLRINSINLQDGGQPDQSVFSSFTPGTMDLSAQLLSWDSNTVKELYNGKQIFLTLKNEATNSHPTFGKNTVFFIGQIDNLAINVDPVNGVTNLNISATDVLSAAMNTLISFTKTASGKAIDLGSALVTAQNNGQISEWVQFDLNGMGATYELTGGKSGSIGELITDQIVSDVCVIRQTFSQVYSGGWTIKRILGTDTISATGTTGELIPESLIASLMISQDGANIPTAFDLSNSTATYSYGTTTANTLSNPNIYSATIDVPTAFLPTIANKISQYTQNIQPVELTVRSAQSNQIITFDDNQGDFIFPVYLWGNGQFVKTTLSYTGATYYHKVVGISHTIDVDGWTTTYQLWKGL